MDKPVGKDSGRTFKPMDTHIPDPCWIALLAKSSYSLNIVNLIAFRILGNRVTHGLFVNYKVTSDSSPRYASMTCGFLTTSSGTPSAILTP